MDIFKRLESDARSYCRRYPTVFHRASDCCMFDVNGYRYIDFLSGSGSVNYGHNNQYINSCMVSYLTNDGVLAGLDLHSTAKRSFIQRFEASILEPRALNYKMQFTGPTGTSVIESAVKLARKCTGRRNVVAFTNGFHGMSATSLSLTGSRYHRNPLNIEQVTRLPFDGYMGEQVNTIAYFRKLLIDNSSGIDLPAAVVVETVQGEGGINVASTGWLRQLRALTEEFGILLIIDDIQMGCGRTGDFFSFERAGIVPDMVCLAKSLGGSGLPFSLLLLKKELDQWRPGEDNGTFRGNNLAFVSASAALERFWSDRTLETQVKASGELVAENIAALRRAHPERIKATRGIGLVHGIEFFDPQDAGKVASRCFESGLIIECCGPDDQVVKILPPLVISEPVLREGLAIVRHAISMTLG